MAFWLHAVLVTALAAVTLLPMLPNDSWWVRDLDFPRLQFAALALLLLLAQALIGGWESPTAWVPASVAFGCFLYQAFWIQPYTRLHRTEAKTVSARDAASVLRIMSVNVLMLNRNAEALLRIVRQERPDFLIAVETDLWWQERLDALEDEMPFSVKCPLDNLYGMHVYSRFALKDPAIQYLVEPDIPSIHASVVLPCGTRVKVHCLHPKPPSPTENPRSTERDAELMMVARSVSTSEKDDPVIVAGDLNDVAWSATTRLFRKVSGLLDPRVGRGMYNTFHADYLLFRWPLDHLFHSEHFGVVNLKRLPAFGSDHFPILVELALVKGLERQQEGLKGDGADRALAERKISAEDVSPADVHTPGG